MVCLVLIVFVISWMPLQIIVLYSQFGHSSHDSGEVCKEFAFQMYSEHWFLQIDAQLIFWFVIYSLSLLCNTYSTVYSKLPKWFSSLSYISHFVAYGSSATNPIIYGGFNKNFRHSLYALLHCKFYLINRPNSKFYRLN